MVSGAPSRQRCFALVDCIVATILLGVSLAVTLNLAGRATASQAVGERLTTAAMLADEQLQLVVARGPDDYARRFPVQGQCDAPFADYKYVLKFTGDGTVGTPFQVACTISWTLGGTEKSITIDTLMASRAGSEDILPDPIRTPQTGIVRTPQ